MRLFFKKEKEEREKKKKQRTGFPASAPAGRRGTFLPTGRKTKEGG